MFHDNLYLSTQVNNPGIFKFAGLSLNQYVLRNILVPKSFTKLDYEYYHRCKDYCYNWLGNEPDINNASVVDHVFGSKLILLNDIKLHNLSYKTLVLDWPGGYLVKEETEEHDPIIFSSIGTYNINPEDTEDSYILDVTNFIINFLDNKDN